MPYGYGQEQLYFDQFHLNIQTVAGQRGARLGGTVSSKTQKCETEYFDSIDPIHLELKTSRFGKTPMTPAVYHRRASHLTDYHQGVPIADKSDLIRMMTDPTSAVVAELAAARNRARDLNIIRLATRTAYIRDAARSRLDPVDLPNSNIIRADGTLADTGTPGGTTGAGAATGFTLAKFIDLLTILGESDDDDIAGGTPKMHIVMCRQSHSDLLAEAEQVSSSDYSNIKALVDGRISHFLGFDIHLSEMVPDDGNGNRQVIAYTPRGILETIGEGDFSRLTERDDQSYSRQAYTMVSYGGTRMDEKLVAVAYAAA
jgi:hypothetical protein